MTTAASKDGPPADGSAALFQAPNFLPGWLIGFSSWPAGMLTVAWGQLVVARSRCPEITMQPGGRSALTGFSPFPTQ